MNQVAASAALLTAAIAAFGYVAKLVIEWIKDLIDEHRRRESQLAQLQSLLKAGSYVASAQSTQRNKLAALLEHRTGNKVVGDKEGYEKFFVDNYDSFTAAEMELHGIVRAFTRDGMRPINEAQLKWVQDDIYFKSKSGNDVFGALAKELAGLEVHQILWRAKYEVWIPPNKKHALVYLADEQEHGVGFPKKIDALIEPARQALGTELPKPFRWVRNHYAV